MPKLILNGEIQKPTNITVPARGSGSAACLDLSEWLEDMEKGLETMEKGLEGPLKPWRKAWKGLQSPRAHLLLLLLEVRTKGTFQQQPGQCWEAAVLGNLEFMCLESPSKPSRVTLFQPLRRKLFQVQLMGCISEGHPEELTLPGEADPQPHFSLLLFLLLQPLLGYDSPSEEEMKVQ